MLKKKVCPRKGGGETLQKSRSISVKKGKFLGDSGENRIRQELIGEGGGLEEVGKGGKTAETPHALKGKRGSPCGLEEKGFILSF